MAEIATKTFTAGSKIDGPYRAPTVLLFVNTFLIALWSIGLLPGLSAENGILEMLQLFLAAGAFALFLFASMEDDGPIGSAGAAIAAICAIAMMREIDVRKFVVPDWMMVWADFRYRDTTIAILVIAVLCYLWFRRDHFRGWLALLRQRNAWPIWSSGLLLASCMIFDGGKVFGDSFGMLIEEFIELNGFMLLVVAGMRHCRLLTLQQLPDRT